MPDRTTHEMQVIDAAVRGGGEARPEDAALVDFALMIRAARPEPNAGEINAIDERVRAAGTPGKKRSPEKLGVLAMGGAASLLFAVILAFAVVGGVPSGDNMGETNSDSSGEISTYLSGGSERATQASGALDELAPPSGVKPTSTTATSPARKETRNAELTLAAPGAEIIGLSDEIIGVTDDHSGYVNRSSVAGGDAQQSAEFSLMIPATEYQDALADFSKLAHVRSRSEQTLDITGAFSGQRRRLARAEQSRDRAAARLAQAAPADRAVLRAQLRKADASVARQRARMNAIRQRVDYVQMNVQLIADESAAAVGSTIDRAFDRAGKILTGAAAVLIVAAAIILPIALIAFLIYALKRRQRRRRANGTLDAAAAQAE